MCTCDSVAGGIATLQQQVHGGHPEARPQERPARGPSQGSQCPSSRVAATRPQGTGRTLPVAQSESPSWAPPSPYGWTSEPPQVPASGGATARSSWTWSAVGTCTASSCSTGTAYRFG